MYDTHSYTIFIVPPIIRANDSIYTATVGSEVILKCNIINHGLPTAVFEWKRNGIQPIGELVAANSFIAIKLSNLTMNDAGKYTCSASNAQSYRSHLVELTILEGKYTYCNTH